MIIKVAVAAVLLIVGTTGRPQEESKKNDEKSTKCDQKKGISDVCLTRACIETSNRLYQNMDTSVDPCEDFNQFACGGFIKNNIIPEDRGSLSAFTPASEQIYIKGRILLEAEQSKKDFNADQKARNYYKACMDQDKIEHLGLKPVHDLLSELGGWPVLEDEKWSEEGFEWYTYMVKRLDLGLGISDIITQYVGQDKKNNSYRVLKLDQPSLGLSREYLIKGFNDTDVQHYYTYMVESAKLMGAKEEKARLDMKNALEFEIKLANISTSRELRRDPNKLYNPTTVRKFEGRPGFPPSMKEYMNDLFKAGRASEVKIEDDEKLIIRDPDYISNLSKLLLSTEKRVISNYLGWRSYKSVVGNLNKAARSLRQEYKRQLQGVASAQPDWKRCVKSVGFNTYSGGAVGLAGSMYVRAYFKPEEKEEMNQMIKYIRGGYKTMLDKVEWMDASTKERAHKKLKLMKQYIAYPDEMFQMKIVDEYYSAFEASPDAFLQNSLNLNKFDTTRVLKQLREKVDPEHWTEHYSTALVNAFYNGDINSMEFPAGILQGVFFNGQGPRYMNYGAIGAVIGHEITHGFDDRGRTQDFEGKLVDWWANETATEYKRRAQCVIEQYGNYTAEQIKLSLNGINTQGENIADNGGIKEAYLGYTNYVKDHGEEPRLPGHNYTPKQMFWISFGQVWCSKYKDGTLKSRILTGVHSPGEFRIKGTLSNNPDFAKDFKCKKGSNMNPAKKCTVW